MIAAEAPARLLDEAKPAVSLYVDIDPDQRDLRAHEEKLRRLVDEAGSGLQRSGASEAGCHLLDSLRQQTAGLDFARHRAPGLALFAANGRSETIELPAPAGDLVTVGPHFHIKPLLRYEARNRRFWLLALTNGDVRLFRATPFALEAVPLELQDDMARAEVEARPAVGFDAGAGQTVYDAERELMVASPGRVTAAVRSALAGDQAIIVLAGDPRVTGDFARDAGLPGLHPRALHVNPFGITLEKLHELAVALLELELGAEREATLEQAVARLGSAETTVAIRLSEIFEGAAAGRVDTVIVAEDSPIWGRFRPGETVIAHGRPSGEDEDLLNLAAVLTLRNGGRAFALPAARLPRQAPAIATLRY